MKNKLLEFVTNQSIKFKINIISAFAIFYLILQASINVYSLNDVEQTIKSIEEHELLIARTTKVTIVHISQLNKMAIFEAITGDDKEKNIKLMSDYHDKVINDLKLLTNIININNHPEEMSLVYNIGLRYGIYSKMALNLYKVFETDHEDGIDEMYGLQAISDKMNLELMTLAKISKNAFNTKLKKMRSKIDFTIQAISIFILIVVLLFIYFSSLISRNIISSITKLQIVLNQFFDYLKDPEKQILSIEVNGDDEISQMTRSVNESIEVSIKIHGEMAQLILAMDKNVITSETDENGIITYVSQAFCEISGHTKKELIGQPHNIVRHPDMPANIFDDLWKTLKQDKVWEGEVKNLKKDGTYYWVHTIISPKCIDGNANCGYTAIRYDITAQKEIEELTKNLEITIKERTQELDDEKELISSIMDAQENLVITSDGKTFKSVNKSFLEFFSVISSDDFIEKYGACVCDAFKIDTSGDYLQKDMNGISWMDYMNANPTQAQKVIMLKGEIEHIFSVTTETFHFGEEILVTVVFTDITEMERYSQEIKSIHKHTRDSIEYASLIQGALIPEKGAMNSYFKDHFVTWTPKDTVGGDIWLFNELRHKDECLLFYIDCTGHGVPGAFVTMIVKAVEREITSIIKADPDMDISPAWIMGYFNNAIKQLLRQESKDSLSNAGWDGGIIYYNKRTQILKFAGAETPLFYMTKDGEYKTVKGNRYSVGYKKCAMDYEYKETTIKVEDGMKFYCTTDGYLDQNGGEKDFPFGKKRFGNIIKEHHEVPMAELQTILQAEMMEYEAMVPNNDRNDDMTVIAFEIGNKSKYTEHITYEILKYEGQMTQNAIAACMDNIEVKIIDLGMKTIISTITIEYCQNMMNYSTNSEAGSRQIVPAGEIEIQNIDNQYFEIMATNIISIEDKEKIEPKLIEVKTLDSEGIKERYREPRKSGENTHKRGGGIGMYEIAKISDSIEYRFKAINDDKYYFTMKSIVRIK